MMCTEGRRAMKHLIGRHRMAGPVGSVSSFVYRRSTTGGARPALARRRRRDFDDFFFPERPFNRLFSCWSAAFSLTSWSLAWVAWSTRFPISPSCFCKSKTCAFSWSFSCRALLSWQAVSDQAAARASQKRISGYLFTIVPL
jgi:hypothetical protein